MLENDALSKEELQAKLGKSGKITSTRLGELVKNDVIVKTADDKFRITTFGVAQMQKEILPKIKAKTTA
jgi:DNA-directed RNA polymerase subunit H (RpoH/RPB5)